MTKATTPSGSIDEAIAFRQGVSVVTIKDQLTGMLPKFSAGTRSRIVVDGNAPDSDIYYDDSMVGLGPGTIVPAPAQILPVFIFDHDFSKFEELYDITNPGINKLEVSGSYTGELDATFRIQIANQDDDDVYTISSPSYMPSSQSGLNDLTAVVQNIVEVNDEGEETIVVASGSYDASQGISVYKVEIASAEPGAVDTIRWYKNGELLTSPGAEEVITANNGNVLNDGDNKIVVKFEYDGFDDIRFGEEAKHIVGDSWIIVAGAQQFRWSKGSFDIANGATINPIEGTSQSSGGPVGIINSGYQHLADGIYIKFPAQEGYNDGSDPNEEPPLWEFNVISEKPEAAITAMQEASGKIQIYPDHRTEQRDFGQPKFHNDFDTAVIDQHQVSTVEVLRIDSIGQQEPSWVPLGYGDSPRTQSGNTQLYNSTVHNKKNYSYEEANAHDEAKGLPLSDNLINPINRAWQKSNSSHDGSVGPYFTIRDLREKEKKSFNNHFWFNFGNTTTSDITRYDDKDPSPELSTSIPIDISGRDLSQIDFSNQRDEIVSGIYEVYNIPALAPIPQDEILDGQTYWSNDLGVTMVGVNDVHPEGDPGPIVWPTSINSSGNNLYYLLASTAIETAYLTATTLGWSPDLYEDGNIGTCSDSNPAHTYDQAACEAAGHTWTVNEPRMSTDMYGNVILDPGTGMPTPLSELEWMQYHGYEKAEFSEIEWLQREGYIAYRDALHNKYFSLYDASYQGYYVQFNVIDNLSGTPVNEVDDVIDPSYTTLNSDQTTWMIDTDGDDVPDKKKSSSRLRLIRVNLRRYDSSKVVNEKLIKRINKEIPSSLLAPSHPFYTGYKVNEVFTAMLDESDNNVTRIELSSPGKIQESDLDSLFTSEDLSEFQVYIRAQGSLGYSQNILLSDEVTTSIAGNCICIYNSTEYGYDSDGDGIDELTPAGTPHIIWFNLNGTATSPEAITTLWSYDLDDDYETEIASAFAAGNVLEILIYPDTPGRTITYLVDQAIKNDPKFIIPFISITDPGSSTVRILQRDPGLVTTTSVDIPDEACHEVNAPVTTSQLREGITTSPDFRDRDYISDSIVFAVSDPEEIKERFSAEKRIVENFAHFQVNCVAEQKSGLLFDYTGQSWVDPDPDVGPALAKSLKGGKSELSNYEPNTTELFGSVPQKEISGLLVWKQAGNSTAEVFSSDAGFDDPTLSSRNRIIWTNTDDGTFHTAVSLGLEDDILGTVTPDGTDYTMYVSNPLTEEEWMTYEGYVPVPAFTHKIAQAAYFLLPHPEKNFYVWFDVGQLSADPGDDGQLDPVAGVNVAGDADNSYIGGGVRIAIDSYDTAGTVAQKLVDRINSDRYDTKKIFVQVGIDDEGDPAYQALASGNINKYFTATINEDDSSIVDIVCSTSGLISVNVFNENNLLSFPTTESGDEFSVTLLEDGDTDYYVDIKNTTPGFVVPPTTDVVRPDADTGLSVTVTDIAYSPAQPGLTKVVSKFLPYEDMNSLSRGYRKTLEDGTEVALAGPVAYIQDDIGMLSYPIIMSNVSMKDPDQYDGVIEPLEIRSRASRNSPDAYFVAHDVRGELQSDVASDSRKRSNPITQFINNAITVFEPYEDGIEHMEASPSVDAFTRTPRFSGVGLNDISILGTYSAPVGSVSSMYDIECVASYESGDINDKFRWRKDSGEWAETLELINTDLGSRAILTFDEIISGSSTEIKTLSVPPGSFAYNISIYARGDINSADENYVVQYLDESVSPGVWTNLAPAINDLSHPLYSATPTSGSGYTPGRYGYSSTAHWDYQFETGVEAIPLISTGALKLRIMTSPNVSNLFGVKNSVKIVTEFSRTAGILELSDGLIALFDHNNGHTAGDAWQVEAVAKTTHDSVGHLPFPGYLTWQESRIDPFVESTDPEESVVKLSTNPLGLTQSTTTMSFNYDGYTDVIEDSTWEIEYVSSLNGQAFTLEDADGSSTRFEFDNDGVLENDGETLIPLLRNEKLTIRFPDVDKVIQKREAVTGHKFWIDDTAPAPFTAYAPPVGYTSFADPLFSEITESEWAENYNLLPSLTSPADISSTLQDAESYSNAYFIITDEVAASQSHINNTVVGGRYAVWYNIIDSTTLSPISGQDSLEDFKDSFYGAGIDAAVTVFWDPVGETYDTAANLGAPGGYASQIEWEIGEGYYSSRINKVPSWSEDEGKTIKCATPTGTGWNPDYITQKMSVDRDGNKLWSNDSGMTVGIASSFGLDDTVAEDHADHPLANGYLEISLTEQAWHEYEGFEPYGHLIPQVIEVKVKNTDNINILVKKTTKAIRTFKNNNQLRVFNVRYIHPPSYIDLHDLDPALDSDMDGTTDIAEFGGSWAAADYDDILHVRLEDSWFNQYAYDPNSPPVKEATDLGWVRGFISIEISSRNYGYHNITSRIADGPSSHEPLYQNIPSPGVPGELDFTIENDESSSWGGYNTFRDLLYITSEKINSSSIKITSEVSYENDMRQLMIDGVPQFFDPDPAASSIDNGISLTSVDTGIPYNVFAAETLITNNFIRFKNSIDDPSMVYIRKLYLTGLRLTQDVSGEKGNTKTKFHYYEEGKKGNILLHDFTGGTTTGPHIDDIVAAMHPGSTDIRPHDHKSASAGMIYNEMPCGTDSITFGGLMKSRTIKVKST